MFHSDRHVHSKELAKNLLIAVKSGLQCVAILFYTPVMKLKAKEKLKKIIGNFVWKI